MAKSTAHKVWIYLSKKKAGTKITVKTIHKIFSDTSNAATVALADMARTGALDREQHGVYVVNDTTLSWGENHRWQAYGKRAGGKRKPKKTVDVIEELLIAWEIAEPELRRLQEQDKLLRQAREL